MSYCFYQALCAQIARTEKLRIIRYKSGDHVFPRATQEKMFELFSSGRLSDVNVAEEVGCSLFAATSYREYWGFGRVRHNSLKEEV